MNRRAGIASWLLGGALALLPASASAVELREGQRAQVAITLPDGWTVSAEGAWSLADAPDHRAHLRVATHGGGLLGDLEAEAYLINFIAQTWGTYTVDRHVRRVTCGRWAGLELYGHGSGDSWDRAKFHLFLLVDPSSPQRGAVVLISGREDAWDAYHPALDRAVHAIHAG